MRIEFGEYWIRDWVPQDAGAIARYANNRKIAMWLRDRFPVSLHRVRRTGVSIAGGAAGPADHVCDCDAGARPSAGSGWSSGSDVHRFTAELGYWLGEPFWGRGIMTDAVRCFTDWTFGAFEVHRLYSTVFDGNHGSVRVLEKAGFQREGRLRASVFKNGRIMDQLLYARIKDGIVDHG